MANSTITNYTNALLDEDDMSSDSDTQGATQQSIKAYVDSSSGGLTLLATETILNDATVEFTSGITSAYSAIVFYLDNVAPATDAVDLYMRFSINGGISYDSGATDYTQATVGVDSAGTTQNVTGTASAIILTSVDVGNNSNEFVSGYVTLNNPSAGGGVAVAINCGAQDSGAGLSSCVGRARYGASGFGVSAVQFLMSSGNILTGTIRMYGVKAS